LSEWTDPIDELPWDSGEGGWQLGHPVFTDELFEEIGNPFANETIADTVIGNFADRQWVEREFLALRRHEALILGWRTFAEWITLKTTGDPDPWSDDAPHELGEVAPHRFLEEIGKVARQVPLDVTLPAHSRFWRARRHAASDRVVHGADLGSPPAASAEVNRMSRAGVSMFYGTAERQTAITEARGMKLIVSIGQFETARDFRIINLTGLPEIPSLYDRSRRHLRDAVRFLQSFVQEVSKRVQAGREIEYLPTQVVTEFFRDTYRCTNGETVRGIRYPSSQGAGSCVVLFCDNANCCDIADRWTEAADKWLGLDLTTLETRPSA